MHKYARTRRTVVRFGRVREWNIAYAGSVSLDWKCGPLADGLRCYRDAEFFQAHEHWELVWLGLKEPEKSFLQAIIQITAAFHHIQAGNRIGGASLLRRALRRFETSPARFAGIEVTRLSTGVREWLRILESAAPAIPPAVPPIDPTDVPLKATS